jgi:type IV pilus assembly protein PilM
MKILKDLFQKFSRNEKNNFIGLDIGSYSIKMVEISLSGDKPTLNGFCQARTFETTIINQIVNDEQLLRTNLKNIFTNFQPKTHRIFLSIPYELTIFGKFSVNSPEALQEIEKQINDEIPYKLDDVYYSYFILPEKGSYDVYYLVAKKDNIDKVHNIFKSLNYNLENIDADFINLHNFFEFLYGQENRAIIDWGHEKIKIHFSNKDVPVYTRELFNLGFKELKNKVVKDLKVTHDMAERYLHNPPADTRGLKIKEFYKDFIKKLLEEVKFGGEIVKTKYGVWPEVFYIIGGGARIPGIHSLISDLLKVEVRKVTINKKINISENIDPNYLNTISTQGIMALATAMKELI